MLYKNQTQHLGAFNQLPRLRVKNFSLHYFSFFTFSEIEGVASDSVNEKVIQDKKRKLQETLDRVLSLYVGPETVSYTHLTLPTI